MTEDEKKQIDKDRKEIETQYNRRIAEQFREFVKALEEVLDKKELKDPNTGKQLASDKDDDGRTRWTIVQIPLKALNNPGLSLTEICSLYMSRALLAAMPGAAFSDGLAGLMTKVERSLAPNHRHGAWG